MVEGLAHAALGGVFDGDDGVVGLALFDGGEDVADGRHGVVVHAGAEFPHGGDVGIGGFGPEVGDEQRLFERDGRRHDLAVDRLEGFVFDRPLVHLGDLAEDGVFALGDVDLAALRSLELADFGGEAEAPVEQLHDLAVEVVDFFAVGREIHGQN